MKNTFSKLLFAHTEAGDLTPAVMQVRLAEIQRDMIVDSAKAGNVVISGDATPLIQVK